MNFLRFLSRYRFRRNSRCRGEIFFKLEPRSKDKNISILLKQENVEQQLGDFYGIFHELRVQRESKWLQKIHLLKGFNWYDARNFLITTAVRTREMRLRVIVEDCSLRSTVKQSTTKGKPGLLKSFPFKGKVMAVDCAGFKCAKASTGKRKKSANKIKSL